MNLDMAPASEREAALRWDGYKAGLLNGLLLGLSFMLLCLSFLPR